MPGMPLGRAPFALHRGGAARRPALMQMSAAPFFAFPAGDKRRCPSRLNPMRTVQLRRQAAVGSAAQAEIERKREMEEEEEEEEEKGKQS